MMLKKSKCFKVLADNCYFTFRVICLIYFDMPREITLFDKFHLYSHLRSVLFICTKVPNNDSLPVEWVDIRASCSVNRDLRSKIYSVIQQQNYELLQISC